MEAAPDNATALERRVGSSTGTAATLCGEYARVRQATVRLVAPLSAEDCAVQSMPDASPAKWHLAHTSWFFEQFLLQPSLVAYRPYHERFGFLFNSYYESVGSRHARPRRGLLTRPALGEVLRYREHVDEHMARLMDAAQLEPELEALVRLGLNHEQQHQELLLTDIKHLLYCNPLLPAYREDLETARADRRDPRPPSWIACDGGLCEIGALPGSDFCFDNELPRHRIWIEPFDLAGRPVTNGEYLEFIREGGYAEPRHWLSDGWATVQSEDWRRPLYWSESLDSEFTLGGMRVLQPDAPVCHLSFYEADAFARWVGARLPTEAEWETAASGLPVEGNLADRDALHPRPARGDALPAQMFGDVWEWTASAYQPYPGFRPATGAIGEYNGKFMCNQQVLRGGSCVTPQGHVRASYRNFFYPQSRWQFAGLRLARGSGA